MNLRCHFKDITKNYTNSWNTRYSFSAKEKDEESGYGYFGARYYGDISIWISVDPMADKYPSLSPYAYCMNNPINLIDPNGMEIDVSALYAKKDDGTYKHKFAVKAFETFAKTKGGRAELAKQAKACQTIAGQAFEKDGAFHTKGIDVSFSNKTTIMGASAQTYQEIIANSHVH
jgi:RHS repeat-associated protein